MGGTLSFEVAQWLSQHSLCLVSSRSLLFCRFEAWRCSSECGMWWSHVNVSNVAQEALSLKWPRCEPRYE